MRLKIPNTFNLGFFELDASEYRQSFLKTTQTIIRELQECT